MSNLIEPTPEEPNANGPSGPNRTLILIALGLAGVLVLGLLGVFGFVAAQRFGLLGRRDSPTPVISTPSLNGTRLPTAPAAGTPGTPAAGTPGAVSPGTAATAAAAATATRAAASGTIIAPTATRVIAVGTVVGPTAVGTRVGTAAPTTIAQAATSTPTLVVQAATATPEGGTAGPSVEVTPSPTPEGGTSQLPDTGAELDLLIIAGLLVILLVLARSFRAVLRA